MINELADLLDKLDHLSSIIKDINDQQTHARTKDRGNFFVAHGNFLVKSCMVTLCGYLELYLKDVLRPLLLTLVERIDQVDVPYNLVLWSL